MHGCYIAEILNRLVDGEPLLIQIKLELIVSRSPLPQCNVARNRTNNDGNNGGPQGLNVLYPRRKLAHVGMLDQLAKQQHQGQ